MKFVSSQEMIEFHDRLISRDGGVAGMPESGRADAIIHRVLNMYHYEGVTDIMDLAAVYLLLLLVVTFSTMQISEQLVCCTGFFKTEWYTYY